VVGTLGPSGAAATPVRDGASAPWLLPVPPSPVDDVEGMHEDDFAPTGGLNSVDGVAVLKATKAMNKVGIVRWSECKCK
jgi:hypothetical protein